MMRWMAVGMVAAVVGLAAMVAEGARAQGPTFSTFPIPGAGAMSVNSMNRFGAVAGYYVDYMGDSVIVHGFLRAPDGSLQTIDYPNSAGDTEISAVNNAGTIAGYYAKPNAIYHGIYQAAGDAMISFDAPGAGYGGGFIQGTLAKAMNASGTIAGYYIDNNFVKHGFVRTAGGTIMSFDAPGAGGDMFDGTQTYAINDGGAVTGVYSGVGVWGAFVRSPKGPITTFNVPNSGSTTPQSINARGEIAGFYTDPGVSEPVHGFIRALDGTFTTFDAPGAGTGNTATLVRSINDQGYVAGSYNDKRYVEHGFIRSPGGAIVSFNAPGATLKPDAGTYAFAINAMGQVAGFYSTLTAVYGFVLTP